MVGIPHYNSDLKLEVLARCFLLCSKCKILGKFDGSFVDIITISNFLGREFGNIPFWDIQDINIPAPSSSRLCPIYATYCLQLVHIVSSNPIDHSKKSQDLSNTAYLFYHHFPIVLPFQWRPMPQTNNQSDKILLRRLKCLVHTVKTKLQVL